MLFREDGRVVESCNTLMQCTGLDSIYEKIIFLEGIQDTLHGVGLNHPVIIFPRIEIQLDNLEIKALDFFLERSDFKNENLLLLIIEDNTEEHNYISQLQQEGRESMIEKEFLELQKKVRQSELDYKNRELAANLLHSIQKNELLADIQEEIKKIMIELDPVIRKKLNQVSKSIENNLHQDKDWNSFKIHFEQIHPHFFENLNKLFPSLSQSDLKVCAYIHLNFSTKEIAKLLNISFRSVQIYRYRLKKKMGLDVNKDLKQFINTMLQS